MGFGTREHIGSSWRGGEVQFSRMAFRRDKELQRRSDEKIAEANDRAADAELKTERLRSAFSWRRLSSESITTVSKVLAGNPKYSITITYAGADPEADTFGHEIGNVFAKNGWNVGYVSAGFFENIVFGIRVPLFEPPNLDACAIAQMALSSAGIDCLNDLAPDWSFGVGSGQQTSAPCAEMYVGPKPAALQE